jgi:hypothetical protein
MLSLLSHEINHPDPITDSDVVSAFITRAPVMLRARTGGGPSNYFAANIQCHKPFP